MPYRTSVAPQALSSCGNGVYAFPPPGIILKIGSCGVRTCSVGWRVGHVQGCPPSSETSVHLQASGKEHSMRDHQPQEDRASGDDLIWRRLHKLKKAIIVGLNPNCKSTSGHIHAHRTNGS